MKSNKLFLSLSGLLLLTLIISSLSVNVKGANTLDFTFEKDVIFDEINPKPNFGYNTRNQTTFTEIYNATYTFTDDINGGNPTSWTLDESGGTINVISDLDGHNKVVEIHDTNGAAYNIMEDTSMSKTSGTIEFWMFITDNTKTNNIWISDGGGQTNSIYILISSGYFNYVDGGTNQITPCSNDVWYHVRIDFRFSGDAYLGLAVNTFKIHVNGESFGPYNDMGTPTTLNSIEFTSGTVDQGYYLYLDAIGYSWDKIHYTGESFDISAQETNPIVLTHDGNNFWILGNDNKRVFKYNNLGVYQDFSFDVAGQINQIGGITWDGNDFWISDQSIRKAYKYNNIGIYQSTYFNLNEMGETPRGMEWDGNDFWIVSGVDLAIHKYNSLGVYQDFSFNVSEQTIEPDGLAWDGNDFWVLGKFEKKIFKYNALGIYQNYNFDTSIADIYINDVIFYNEHIWGLGRDNDRVYKFNLNISYLYNIGDNVIPYNYKNNTTEIDKWTFFNNEDGTLTENWQANIPYWERLMIYSRIGKGYGGIDNTTVRVPITSSTPYGIYKDFQYDGSDVIEIDIITGLDISSGSVEFNNSFQIKSFDDTLIVRINFDYYSETKHKLTYWDGSNDNFLQYLDNTFLFRNFNFTIINDLVVLTIEDNTYMFSTIVLNKDGLGEIRIDVDVDIGGVISHLYIDSVGVYINGISLSNDFANYYYQTEGDYDHARQHLFNLNATGFFGCSMINFEIVEGHNFFSYQNVINISFINTINDHQCVVIKNAYFTITTNVSYIINSILIQGLKLTEGSNEYFCIYTENSINNTESYFYVFNNKLYWKLVVDDSNLEYMQMVFNVKDVPSEDRSISFTSNIDGQSKGFFSLDYTDDTINLFEFPYYETSTKIILPQTKTIETFTILITDNDLLNSDICSGYVSNIRLLYNPDIEISILITTIIAIIIPLMVMVLPSVIMGKKFGVPGVIMTFLLMSLVCVIGNLIPIWLFFIIAFCTIGFLVMKKEIEVRI